MEFSIPRKICLKILSFCQSITEKKTTVPVLSHFLLNAENGKVQITATNLDMVITEEVNADVAKSGSWCVPSALTYDIIRKLEGFDTLKFKYNAKTNRIVLTSKKAEFQIPVLDPNKFPDITKTPLDISIDFNSKDLKKLIDETKFCMSMEEIRYHLNGIYFHHVDGALRCVTTDMHRLALSAVDLTITEAFPSIIIGRKAIQEIRKLIDDEPASLTFSASETRVQCVVKTDDFSATLSSRLIDASFPDYQKIFDIHFEKKVLIERVMLEKILDRLSVFVDEKMKSVKFSFTKNKLTAEITHKELGAAKEECDISYDYEDFCIQLNIFYILDILKNQKCEWVEFSMKGSYDSILVKPKDVSYPQYIVMPLAD